MNRNKEACHCKRVTYGMIEDAVKDGAKNYEEVQAKTKFAAGCGQCKEFITFYIKQLVSELEKH